MVGWATTSLLLPLDFTCSTQKHHHKQSSMQHLGSGVLYCFTRKDGPTVLGRAPAAPHTVVLHQEVLHSTPVHWLGG